MIIPRSTEEHPPVADPATGEIVRWIGRSFALLSQLVSSTIPKLNAIRRGMADELISAWWAPPDGKIEAADPISVTEEFLRKTHRDGTYYVRIRTVVNEDDQASYFSCKAPGAQDDAGPVNATARLETALSRGVDTLEALNTKLEARYTAALEENERLRAEGHAKDDTIAEQARTIKRVEAERDDALEDSGAIFDEDSTGPLLKLLEMWAKMPAGGMPEKLFTSLLSAVLGLLSSFEADKEIQALIVARHADAWKAFRAAFNGIAEEAKQSVRLYSVEEMIKTLPRRLRPKGASNGAARARA